MVNQYIIACPVQPRQPEGETRRWMTLENGSVKSVVHTEDGGVVSTWDHSQNKWQLLIDAEEAE